MYDVIIVGSGASSAAAAYELKEKKVLILDIGYKPPSNSRLEGNIFDLRQKDPDQQKYLIGNHFESLSNIFTKDPVSLKLKAPYLAFVTQKPGKYLNLNTNNFTPFLSYAYGGLANAWGYGVYPFTEYDLKDLPLTYKELVPFYKKLGDHIGISGAADDLEAILGPTENMQPPVKMDINSRQLFQAYNKKKNFFYRRNIKIGRSRIALLTEKKNERPACSYENLGFFTSRIPYIYNPATTLDSLLKSPNIIFKEGYMAQSFGDFKDKASITALNLKTEKTEKFWGKKILLAAGSINSAKIVLNSYHDYNSRLPILDNPVSFIPFINLRTLGAKLNKFAFEGGPLNLIYQGKHHPDRVMGSVYSYISPLRSDIFFNFPFSFKGNLFCSRYITPAMTIVQLFYSESPGEKNYLQLQRNNSLLINYPQELKKGELEKHLIKTFRRIGFISASSLIQYPKPGNSIHYAGTIPMSKDDKKYTLNKNCLLKNTSNIYVVDGSFLSRLPAKNLTFTIMANAMRVASIIKKDLA